MLALPKGLSWCRIATIISQVRIQPGPAFGSLTTTNIGRPVLTLAFSFIDCDDEGRVHSLLGGYMPKRRYDFTSTWYW